MTDLQTAPDRVRARRRPAVAGGAGPAEHRELPVYEAGGVEVPFVIAGSQEEMARNTSWAEHSHPTHELLWNERGSSSATVGPRTWTITRTIGLWIPAGVRHSGWTPAGTLLRAALLHIDRAPAIADGPVAVGITPLLRLLLDRLTSEELSDESRAITETMVIDVLTPAPRELLLHVPTAPLLAPIVQTVADRPADDTTLAGWASRLGVSTRTITRAFHAETGLGFGQWVGMARCRHAIVLLAQGEDIEDVARSVGFGSSSAFSTAFRRTTGMSPGRFRTQ
nr:AraC family transcriptional regulator [Nakamurella alba]